jgi:hypothetical protein
MLARLEDADTTANKTFTRTAHQALERKPQAKLPSTRSGDRILELPCRTIGSGNRCNRTDGINEYRNNNGIEANTPITICKIIS